MKDDDDEDTGEWIEPPSAHLIPLVDEVLDWELKRQRGISFADLGYVPSMELLAALDAYSMGLNWAEHELAEERREEEERRAREAERSAGRR